MMQTQFRYARTNLKQNKQEDVDDIMKMMGSVDIPDRVPDKAKKPEE